MTKIEFEVVGFLVVFVYPRGCGKLAANPVFGAAKRFGRSIALNNHPPNGIKIGSDSPALSLLVPSEGTFIYRTRSKKSPSFGLIWLADTELVGLVFELTPGAARYLYAQ